MAAPDTCRVCSGALVLRHRGSSAAPDAEAFSPSCHTPGAHGDLYACVECGTVQQPSLPAAAELAGLYREMSDEAYLAEEPGRRATARRLLDMIGALRARRAPARRGLRPRPAARRGARPRVRGRGRRAVAQRGRVRPRRARAPGARDPAGGGRGRAARASPRSSSPTCSSTSRTPVGGHPALPRAAEARRCAVRNHSRPGLGHGAARRRALVGAAPRARVPGAAHDAARAARGGGPGGLRRRLLRPHVLRALLAVRLRRARGRARNRRRRAGEGAARARKPLAVARRRARRARPQRRGAAARRSRWCSRAAASTRCTSCCRPTGRSPRSSRSPRRCRSTRPTARCSWTTRAPTRP